MVIAALRRMICRRRQDKSVGGFARDDDGSAAVEFALTAPVFFALMLSIFEYATLFGTNVLLEAATTNGARAVRTGQVFIGSLSEGTDPVTDPETGEVDPNPRETEQKKLFRDAMCDSLLFIDCDDLLVNIEVFTQFDLADADVFCTSDRGISKENFDIGKPAQIVVLTVVYPYDPIITNPFLTSGHSPGDGTGCGGLSMKSVMIFINEPFPQTLSTPPTT